MLSGGLLENLTSKPDITNLTQHLGFEASCLNPFGLQITYINSRQEYDVLKSSRYEKKVKEKLFITL